MGAYLYVALGAIVGANLRFVISRWFSRVIGPSFPYGTMVINVTGSFALGVFMTLATERTLLNPRWRLMFAIGFCGAYTTFSSYAFESISLLEQGQWFPMLANVFASNLLCLAAVIGGIALVRAL